MDNFEREEKKLERIKDFSNFLKSLENYSKTLDNIFGISKKNIEKIASELYINDEHYTFKSYLEKIHELKSTLENLNSKNKKNIEELKDRLKSTVATAEIYYKNIFPDIGKISESKHRTIAHESIMKFYNDIFSGIREITAKTPVARRFASAIESFFARNLGREGFVATTTKAASLAFMNQAKTLLDTLMNSLKIFGGTITKISIYTTFFATILEVIFNSIDRMRKFFAYSQRIGILSVERGVTPLDATRVIYETIYKSLDKAKLLGTGLLNRIQETIFEAISESRLFAGRTDLQELKETAENLKDAIMVGGAFGYTDKEAASTMLRFQQFYRSKDAFRPFLEFNVLALKMKTSFEELMGVFGGFENVLSNFGEKAKEIITGIVEATTRYSKNKLDSLLIAGGLSSLLRMDLVQQAGYIYSMLGPKEYKKFETQPTLIFRAMSDFLGIISQNVKGSPFGTLALSQVISNFFGTAVGTRFFFNSENFRERFLSALREADESRINKLKDEALLKEDLTVRTLNEISNKINLLEKIVVYIEDIKTLITMFVQKIVAGSSILKLFSFTTNTKNIVKGK